MIEQYAQHLRHAAAAWKSGGDETPRRLERTPVTRCARAEASIVHPTPRYGGGAERVQHRLVEPPVAITSAIAFSMASRG
jgi:hypothetical protein